MSKFKKACQILHEDGFNSLKTKSIDFLLQRLFRFEISRPLAYHFSRTAILRRMQQENNLEDIIDTVTKICPGYREYRLSASQLKEELYELAELVESRNPKVIMEIGTSNGGTFYTWCRHFKDSSKIISLDLPDGRFGGGYNPRKEGIYRQFASDSELHFVRENSHKKKTYQQIKQNILSEGETIDFLFIDGDHTYEGVKSDFQMYQRLVADDGIIALHDIVEHPSQRELVENRKEKFADLEERHLKWGQNFEDVKVHEFWEELQDEYETQEIISHNMQSWGGIGLIHWENQ